MGIVAFARNIISILRRPHGPLIQIVKSITSPWNVRMFTIKNFRFPFKVAVRVFRLWPRYDSYLLKRKPKLIFESKRLIKVDRMYSPDGEIRIDDRPYTALFDLVKPLIQENRIDSILEIGCTSGNLIYKIKNNFPNKIVEGIEIFDFHKAAASPTISGSMHILDLRQPFDLGKKYDLVICLEVGEHIDPSKLDTFLDNIKFHTSKYLLMSWSSSYPPFDAPPQHLSPLHRWQFRRLVEAWG